MTGRPARHAEALCRWRAALQHRGSSNPVLRDGHGATTPTGHSRTAPGPAGSGQPPSGRLGCMRVTGRHGSTSCGLIPPDTRAQKTWQVSSRPGPPTSSQDSWPPHTLSGDQRSQVVPRGRPHCAPHPWLHKGRDCFQKAPLGVNLSQHRLFSTQGVGRTQAHPSAQPAGPVRPRATPSWSESFPEGPFTSWV